MYVPTDVHLAKARLNFCMWFPYLIEKLFLAVVKLYCVVTNLSVFIESEEQFNWRILKF